MKLHPDQIVVGERRREDYGDIAGLAESIRRYGLIHPIVVDNDHRLIAGGRRLLACKQLGRIEVDVRPYGDLSEAERAELELEENLRRLDLSPYEKSKVMVERAAVAEQILVQQRLEDPVVSATELQKPRPPGRPKAAASEQAVAERLGVSRQAVRNAREHIAAVETYPELADEPSQDEALAKARVLDTVPEAIRPQVREQAKAERATSARLLELAGVADDPEVQRRTLRLSYTQAIAATRSKLLPLDVAAVVDALDSDEQHSLRWFIRDCRQWLDSAEAAMARGLRIVNGRDA